MFDGKNLLVLTLIASLAACGGGGDTVVGNNDGDNGNNDPPAPVMKIGVFADSAVSGIGYHTDTREGRTNADGEFEYVDGETIVFFIGDTELPPVAGGEIVTPLDVFDTDDFTDRRVINLARLLQSLDQDEDPDNGIQIAAGAHEVTGLMLDFDVPTETFEASSDVINFVSAYGGSGTLVSATAALAHLQQLSIVGSWQIFDPDWHADPEESDSITLVFMADGTYMNAEGTAFVDGDPGVPGIEYGTYTWNPLTGEIEVDVEFDTNNTWGLSDFDLPLTRIGNSLSFPNPDPDPDDKAFFLFALAADQDDALVGGWMAELSDGGNSTIAIVVFTGEYYSWAEFGPEAPTGVSVVELGAEFGTYTWNAQTGALMALPLIDHNGDWAFSGGAQVTANVDGDTLNMAFPDSEEVTLTRVK